MAGCSWNSPMFTGYQSHESNSAINTPKRAIDFMRYVDSYESPTGYSYGYSLADSLYGYDYRATHDTSVYSPSTDTNSWVYSPSYSNSGYGYGQSMSPQNKVHAHFSNNVKSTSSRHAHAAYQYNTPPAKCHRNAANDTSTPQNNVAMATIKSHMKKEALLSPIYSHGDDLAADLAPFEFVDICDVTNETQSDCDVISSFLDVTNDAVPTMKDLSELFDDIHGSINTSDLNIQPQPSNIQFEHSNDDRGTTNKSLHSNTTVWDSGDNIASQSGQVQVHYCQYCCTTCNTYLALFKHEKNCPQNPLHYCAICEKRYKSVRSLKNHRRIQHREVNECAVCHEVLRTARELTNHMKASHKPHTKRIQCYKCGDQFANRYRLTKHMKAATCSLNVKPK